MNTNKNLLGLLLILALGFINNYLNVLMFIPFLGITIFRGNKSNNNNNDLLKPYEGLQEGEFDREQYIEREVSLIDKEQLYSDAVENTILKAGEQWDSSHPFTRRLRKHFLDKDYRNMFSVYYEELSFSEAMFNTILVIIRDNYETEFKTRVFDITLGQFIKNLMQHGLESFIDSYSDDIINSVVRLKTEHGFQFASPTITPNENINNTDEQTEKTLLSNILSCNDLGLGGNRATLTYIDNDNDIDIDIDNDNEDDSEYCDECDDDEHCYCDDDCDECNDGYSHWTFTEKKD